MIPARFNRQSTRLRGYDYCQSGAYFVTISANEIDHVPDCRGDACVALNSTSNSTNVFGHINDDKMIPNEYGQIVEQCWCALPDHFESITLDEFVVMPNHYLCAAAHKR